MRIVIRSQDARGLREIQTRLSAAGIDAMALPSFTREAPDGQDVALFCGHGAEAAAADAMRQEPPPLAALVASEAPPPACGLSAIPGTLALGAPKKLLQTQLQEHIRVAVLEEERKRRAATAAELKLTPDTLGRTPPLRVLYVGAPSAFYLALESALNELGGAVAAAFSSFTGFDHLHDDEFDAVVLNGVNDSAIALSLCSALRRNASLYHLPTMMLLAASDETSAASAIERGATAIAAPLEPLGESLGWLFEAIRRERRRRAAEHDLRALRDAMGDARTGLFKPSPFLTHLDRISADHAESGRPLGLLAIRVAPAFGASRPGPDQWRRGFAEVASLAGRLMREADSAATFDDDVIAIALPASNAAAARQLAERIAAVAECTAFAAGDNGAGPLVFERCAVDQQPGESGAGLLSRALSLLQSDAMSA